MSSQHPYLTPSGAAHNRRDPRSQSRRSMTPNGRVPSHSSRLMASIEGDLGADEDPRLAVFRELTAKSEARLARLLSGEDRAEANGGQGRDDVGLVPQQEAKDDAPPQPPPNLKRKARAIDEDDYDDDDSEADDANISTNVSPLKARSTLPPSALALASSPMKRNLSQSSIPGSVRGAPAVAKNTEDVRIQMEEDKKATENNAKRKFHTVFHTLENDRDAMLEQMRLDEAEQKVNAEMGNATSSRTDGSGNSQQGGLSGANLGTSNLTLKNLIKRIDSQRSLVKASDLELRSLMSEVRKNRSKWASEDKIGQEELYEGFEAVLGALKGQTEHSTHFLNKVNKKEAPDYGTIIKHPMDLGTMTKRLRSLHYKTKKEFLDDLNLIWANCLKYNANPDHYMRKHALFMRKETDKLAKFITDVPIRDRAQVEAEERRKHAGADLDGEEDSDDEPIISSRGRKAPSKKSKKGTTVRKAPAGTNEESPGADKRPATASSQVNGIHRASLEAPNADSEHDVDGSQTPPHRTATPSGVNGILTHGAAGSQSEAMDVDGESMINGVAPSIIDGDDEPEYEDAEYKTWKQVTKKDRALVTAERHRLFKKQRLDPDAPALLRTKAGMRSWLRKQKHAVSDALLLSKPDEGMEVDEAENDQSRGETLAEGMEGEEEKVLPDYYDALAAIPDIPAQLRWVEDAEGNVQDPSEEFLRELPKGLFVSPESSLTKRIGENITSIQKTRKITAKIGVVKQMALQSQLYQGQFQKTEVVPFVEQDVEPHVMSDNGPVIAPEVCRAAMQRSAAQLLVHAGFDEFQPSALDAFTDLASDYFTKLVRDLNTYTQAPQLPVPVPGHPNKVTWQPRFTAEECILHALQENGADLESLDTYVNEDIDRTGTRLATTHDRMKAHLADLLRPALHDAGPDGSGAFNDDSEQFVSGDFAEELGDDFFGFKELGLDLEFGDASMSVPLHLLQKSMYNANRAQNPSSGDSNAPSQLAEPDPYEQITIENVKNQVGLVQNFFLAKLHANGDKPLTEDDDLPVKQRMPKPRLPPTGKITSPRKRPFKEPGPGKGHPRKKLKLNDGEPAKIGELDAAGAATNGENVGGDPVKKAVDAAPKTNGELMSREPSKNDTPTSAVAPAAASAPNAVSISAAPSVPPVPGVPSALSVPSAPPEPAAPPVPADPSMPNVPAKIMTNGVPPTSDNATNGPQNNITNTTTPVSKGKGKEVNGDSGSLPSPESLEAT